MSGLQLLLVVDEEEIEEEQDLNVSETQGQNIGMNNM